MFVKIKLESEENSKKPHIFEIEDGATLYDLKVKLETLVGVPADCQEIHSLAKTLGNDDQLTTLLRSQDFENVNGSAISLFHAQTFVCFLQFYSPSEVDAQRQFFLQPEDAKKLPIDRLPQFCELTDSSDSDSTSSSVSVRSNTSFESASTRSSSPEHKRRRIADVDEASENRQRISTSNGHLNSTFTLTSKDGKTEVHTQEDRINTTSGSSISTCVKNSTKSDTDTEGSSEEDDARTKPLQPEGREEVGCDKSVDRPPYDFTMPENIQYALVISNEDPKAESVDVRALLLHFFSLFENCAGNHLKFSESTTMTKFSSHLIIGCEDSKTAEWVTSAVAGVCPPHSCLPFPKFFGLVRCSFVLPFIVANKPMRSVFDLLEKQNCGLVTDKWSVIGRSILDPGSVDFEQKAVSSLCENEEIDLYIDGGSLSQILDQGSKFKYCFWRLHFEFDSKL